MSAKQRSSIDLVRPEGNPSLEGARQTNDQGEAQVMDEAEVLRRSQSTFDAAEENLNCLPNQPATSRPQDREAAVRQSQAQQKQTTQKAAQDPKKSAQEAVKKGEAAQKAQQEADRAKAEQADVTRQATLARMQEQNATREEQHPAHQRRQDGTFKQPTAAVKK